VSESTNQSGRIKASVVYTRRDSYFGFESFKTLTALVLTATHH